MTFLASVSFVRVYLALETRNLKLETDYVWYMYLRNLTPSPTALHSGLGFGVSDPPKAADA